MKKAFLAVAGVAAFVVSSMVAQASQGGQCVVAGRLNEANQWAPRIAAVQLFNAQGKMVLLSDKAALSTVTQAKINKAVPLSSCDGNQALKKTDDLSDGGKATKPNFMQATDGLVAVKSVAFPSLRTGNGSLVEIQIQ
jgi:putative intracellular protease/amidase